MRLFWHQRDLRTRDNVGLAVGARSDSVLPVYVYDTDLLEHVGRRQRALWMSGVRKLKERYRALGSDLVVRSGESAKTLSTLAEKLDVDSVYYNEHYRPARRNAQRRVEETLASVGIDVESKTDLVLVDPGRLESSYPNHSQFHSDWEQVPKTTPYDEPDSDALVSVDDTKTVPVPEVDIGLFPAQALVPIMRTVNEKQALHLLFTGEHIDPEKAYEIGFVTEVVEADRFDVELDDLVDSLANSSPVMIEVGKRSYYNQRDMGFDEALSYMREIISLIAMSDDTEEGINAFLMDTDPEWKGR